MTKTDMPCPHETTRLQYTGDGTEVRFCLDCGKNSLTGGTRTTPATAPDDLVEPDLVAENSRLREALARKIRLLDAINREAIIANNTIKLRPTLIALLGTRLSELIVLNIRCVNSSI